MPFLARLGARIAGVFIPAPTARTAKVVGIAAIIIAVVLLLGLGKCAYDRALIRNHDANRNAEISNSVTEADRYAGKRGDARKAEFQATEKAQEKAAEAAKAADPENAAKGVGPVSRSYYDTLPEAKR
jgi:F0F1-type ATP synthase membrane subunit b/b'